jgi:hypothetical protein
VYFVDEQDRLLAPRQRVDDGLEPFLEIAAKACARQERGRIQGKDFRAFERRRHVILEQPLREPFGQRRLPHTRVADEHRVVLPPAAEHFERALEFGGSANQRIEIAGRCLRRQVDRVGRQRVASRRASFFAVAAVDRLALALAGRLAGGHFRDAVADVVQHVEPRHALRIQQLRRERLRLLQERSEQISRLDLGAVCALDVEHCSLEGAPERQGLVRLVLASARKLLHLLGQVAIEIAAQRHEIGAARSEDPLTFRGIVRENVQQVLERQMRVPPNRGFAKRGMENLFDRCAEHTSTRGHSSMLARSGNPLSRARSCTVATFVSATSYGYMPQRPLPCV